MPNLSLILSLSSRGIGALGSGTDSSFNFTSFLACFLVSGSAAGMVAELVSKLGTGSG